MGKKKQEWPFAGRWRIVSMSAWDEDYIDEEEEGYFEFDDNGWGGVPLRLCPRPDGLPPHHQGRRTSGRVDLGRQRRDGPGAGAGMGRHEGRRTARHDLL